MWFERCPCFVAKKVLTASVDRPDSEDEGSEGEREREIEGSGKAESPTTLGTCGKKEGKGEVNAGAGQNTTLLTA